MNNGPEFVGINDQVRSSESNPISGGRYLIILSLIALIIIGKPYCDRDW